MARAPSGTRKRRRTKKTTVPKVRPGDSVKCDVPGEQLESVLACYDQVTQSVLPVAMAVDVRENRAEVRKYVDAYLALVTPIIMELLGAVGAAGIPVTHAKWAEFLVLAAEPRAEVSTLKLRTLSLSALVAEQVRMSAAAVDLLVEIGAVLDDR